MSIVAARSQAHRGTAGPVRAVSVISTGSVEIHPEHALGTRKPLYWWLLTSRRWLPSRPINVYVIEHARGLLLFDTGQDRASRTCRSGTTRSARPARSPPVPSMSARYLQHRHQHRRPPAAASAEPCWHPLPRTRSRPR